MSKRTGLDNAKEPRWVVVENTPGYLPENPPEEFHLKIDAENYALELKRELEEIGYKVHGTKREGYYADRDESDLGRAISIEPFVE